MTERLYIKDLLRLTLTRKGRAIAKHPLLRTGVIEAVKASPEEEDPLWEAPESRNFTSDEDADWYGDFAAHIANINGEDIPDDWVVSFNEGLTTEKASAKKKNYPDSKGPFAGPHNSFPINSQQDVYDAARLAGHAANPAAVRANIIRIARSKGFSLPKSWAAKKSENLEDLDPMDETQFEELVTRLQERFAPAAPKETDQKTEKASKTPTHAHEHPHSSMRGYGYSHTHPHDHASMDDHETSDSAHGHDHVGRSTMKADDVNIDELLADVAGLDKDLTAAKAEVVSKDTRISELESELTALKASLQEKDTELAEKSAAVEKATADAEAIRKELKDAEEAAKSPLIAGSPTTEKAQKVDPKTLPFDDAFQALLHG